MNSSGAAGKTSFSSDDSADRGRQESSQAIQQGHLRFANKDLLELFRSVRWASTLEHQVARELWRANAPRLLTETSLSQPYMVTFAAEFGCVFDFYACVGEVDNFFSEACIAGDDGICLVSPACPDEPLIFIKRAALLRIGVPLA